jgi:hypothetical protein
MLPRKNIGLTKRCVSICYNISNQWVYKFYYLDGKVTGYFKARKDDAQLIYSSYVEKGMIDFQLFNSKGNLLVSFSGNNTTDTIKGIFEKGEKYKIITTAKKAKGRFEFKME